MYQLSMTKRSCAELILHINLLVYIVGYIGLGTLQHLHDTTCTSFYVGEMAHVKRVHNLGSHIRCIDKWRHTRSSFALLSDEVSHPLLSANFRGGGGGYGITFARAQTADRLSQAELISLALQAPCPCAIGHLLCSHAATKTEQKNERLFPLTRNDYLFFHSTSIAI